MLRFTFVASLVGSLLVSLSVSAGSSSMSPGQALARINSSGGLEVCSRVSKPVYINKEAAYTVQVPTTEMRTRTKKVTVDGVEKEVTEEYQVTVTKPETRTMTTTVMEVVSETIIQSFPAATNGFRREADKAEIPLYDLAGNRLSVTALEDRLQDWTVVLISSTGKPLDRRFASIFKATTIVVGVPPQAPMAMPAPIVPARPMAPPPQPVNPPTAPPAAGREVRSPLSPVAFLADDAMPQLPAAAPPTFAFAKVWGEKTLALRTEDEKTLDVTCMINKEVEKLHEGKPVKVTVCEPRQIEKVIQTQETLRYSLQDVSVTRTPNKEVSNVELPTILAFETLAVVSADGKPVDPLWQRNLREGVLVIVAPQVPQGHYGGTPMMAPGMPGYGPPAPSGPAQGPLPVAPQPAPAPRPVEAPAPPAA